jgi:hypothetical protein
MFVVRTIRNEDMNNMEPVYNRQKSLVESRGHIHRTRGENGFHLAMGPIQ